MQGAAGPEQRKYPRVDIDLPVFVVGRKGHAPARMTNVSLGGCQLAGTLTSRVGEVLAVLCGVKIPNQGFRARVVWAVPGEETVNLGGIFWGADEGARRELVHRLINIARLENPEAAHRIIG